MLQVIYTMLARISRALQDDYTKLSNQLVQITANQEKIMIDVAKIKAAADRANAGIESVLAVLASLTAQVKTLSEQLAAAIAAEDPAAQQAVQADLDKLAEGLNAEADKIAAATAAPATA